MILKRYACIYWILFIVTLDFHVQSLEGHSLYFPLQMKTSPRGCSSVALAIMTGKKILCQRHDVCCH